MAEKEVLQKKLRSQSSKFDDILTLDASTVLDSNERTNEVGPKKQSGKTSSYKTSTHRSESGQTKTAPNAGAKKTSTGKPEASVRTDAIVHTSNTPKDNDSQILTILNAIQENQKKQDDKIAKITTKMQEWENYESYEVVDDSNEAQDDEIVEMEGDGEDEPPRKKQKIDNNNNDSETESESKTKSRFESMANRCKLVDKCDKPIDNILANNINELFRNGMNETLHEEISKQNIVSRPENCEALCVVKTNQLVWDILSPETRSSDKKLQNVEHSLVKGATIIAKVVNRLAIMEKNEKNADFDELIDLCNDSLALMGHANYQLNMTRRDLIKPDMRHGYTHLCASSVPFTKWLFGDNVSKTAKEIEDCSKIAYKMQYSNRGYSARGRGYQYPTRGRGRGRFRARGRGYGGRGGQSKNFRRETVNPHRGKAQ